MKEKVAILAVGANLILAVFKILAGVWAGSSSVIAEGVHSGMDVISSLVGYFGITIAKKPVDDDHPYGHYKYEVLSGLIITLILLATGVWIIYEAYIGLATGVKEIEISYWTLGVMLVSVVVNEVMARLKIYYGKKENSISLVSDGVHSRVDVYSSLVILVGLMFASYWIYLDSVLAILVGLYIIYESINLGKEATESLLDVSAGKKVEEKIKLILDQNKVKYSSIITQKKGSAVSANVSIELDKNATVNEATNVTEKLKNDLLSQIEEMEFVAIQIKSQEESYNYFRSRDLFADRKVVAWRGRNKDAGGQGVGPGGYCVVVVVTGGVCCWFL